MELQAESDYYLYEPFVLSMRKATINKAPPLALKPGGGCFLLSDYRQAYMANKRPTPVSFFRATWLCILLLTTSEKFNVINEADKRLLQDGPHDTMPQRAHDIVRQAFFYSALLVLMSGVFGYLSGLMLGQFTCATSRLIAWLQVAGACILLWGTLFVRGWDIQTYNGVTLTERVNQWLYRFLYCLGTAILVCSLAWPQCTA